ncbi:MAG: hypothetical protein K5695_11220, partial [Oscillospiraceae bacterium]|nr:hypothetical protein [Oscillospiraceae bacterium]
MADTLKLVTEINTQFYKFEHSRALLEKHSKEAGLDTEKHLDILCEKLHQGSQLPVNIARYELSAFPNYELFRRKREESEASEEKRPLVARIDKQVIASEQDSAQKPKAVTSYTISTGLYIGVLNLFSYQQHPVQLEICTPYSDTLLIRMVRYALGIYADTSITGQLSQSKSLYSLLIQMMFLKSLQK